MKKFPITRVLINLVGLALVAVLPAISVRSEPMPLSRNFRPDPIKLEGTAGGNVSLTALAGVDAKCRGFANTQPNHVLELGANFPALDILAYTGNVNDDLTMLIKGAGGLVICADDEHQRRNPQVFRRLPQGSYQIWIGSSEQNKSIKYSLSLSETAQK
jgi:hypothetical protein